MESNVRNNTGGTTKTGYSKNGFSCCGFHYICNLGRLECYHDKEDPEVKEYCSCYQRHHSKKSAELVVKNDTAPSSMKEDVPLVEDLNGQFTLF
jgi:hypothetical protein